MTKPAKPGASAKPKAAKAKSATWAETMKKALKDKPAIRRGPEQPKPRDSGTPKVKKDAF